MASVRVCTTAKTTPTSWSRIDVIVRCRALLHANAQNIARPEHVGQEAVVRSETVKRTQTTENFTKPRVHRGIIQYGNFLVEQFSGHTSTNKQSASTKKEQNSVRSVIILMS